MKQIIHAGFILAAVVVLFGSTVSAQTAAQDAAKIEAEFQKYVELSRKDLRSEKKQFIALNMPLTEAEATKFWPVYDRYAADMYKLFDERIAIIKEYGAVYQTLTDAQASNLSRRTTAVDQSFVDLRMRYIPLVEKVLPGKKAAFFFQLDKRLGILTDLQIASAVPLAIK